MADNTIGNSINGVTSTPSSTTQNETTQPVKPGDVLAKRFDKLDANKSGFLEGKEAHKGMLKRLDANHDSKISKDEFTVMQGHDRSAKFALLDADKNGSLTAGEISDKQIKKLDANGDGKISADEYSHPELAKEARRFDRLDTNHDGKIDSKDGLPDKRLEQLLSKFDANKDTTISRDEFVKPKTTPSDLEKFPSVANDNEKPSTQI